MLEHFTAVFHFLLLKHFNRKELLDDLKIISVKLKCSLVLEKSLEAVNKPHLAVI